MAEMKVELSVEDLKRIQTNLEAVAERIAKGDLLSRVGLRIERQAKINASGRPGPNVQTGRLRASITVQLKEGLPVTEAVVGTNVHYAPPIEFGHAQQVGRFVPIYGMRRITSRMAARGGGTAGRYEVSRGLGVRLVNPTAPAYPFLMPALQKAKDTGELEGAIGEFSADIEKDWMQ